MILLNDETELLEVVASAAHSLHIVSGFVDFTSAATDPGSYHGSPSTAATHVVVPAPPANTKRQVKSLTLRNNGVSPQGLIVQKNRGGTQYSMTPQIFLAPGESLCYLDALGFSVFTSAGVPRQAQASKITGFPYRFFKTGTATEAAGVPYCTLKDAGFPGAMTFPTPGVNGQAVTTALSGSINLNAPGSGSNYLTYFNAVANSVATVEMFDLLWINSGLVVTITTAQTMTPAAASARDQNNSADGLGVMAALLVTAATTNASAVTNMTISYTNSAGVAGRTGTIPSFPATAVVGSLVFFRLQAGDSGVRSIQSITFGTSLVTGAVSLVLVRAIIGVSIIASNAGSVVGFASQGPGVYLNPGVCLFLVITANSALAVNINVNMVVEER